MFDTTWKSNLSLITNVLNWKAVAKLVAMVGLNHPDMNITHPSLLIENVKKKNNKKKKQNQNPTVCYLLLKTEVVQHLLG